MGSVAPEDVSLGSPPLLDPLIFFPEDLDAHQNGALSRCHSRPTNGLPPAVRCVLFSRDEDWGGGRLVLLADAYARQLSAPRDGYSL